MANLQSVSHAARLSEATEALTIPHLQQGAECIAIPHPTLSSPDFPTNGTFHLVFARL